MNKPSHTSHPRFSVVIPCYNESAVIEAALLSLKQQDFTGTYEIIVVDNNCTDDTASKAKNAGVRVVVEKNAGVCWARQKGTESAQGEIIISADADSTFNKNWLSRIDEKFRSDPSVVAVTGPFRYENGPFWAIYADALFGFANSIYKLTGWVLYAPGANTAFKKSAWEGYNTVMTQYGDEVDLLRKLRRKGKVVFNSRPVVMTSPRRLKKGLIYNLFVSLLFYSFLEYNLNRIFKRRFFGQAPAFRDGS